MTDIHNSEIISPPAKRMKQARLPFFALTNKPKPSSTPSPPIIKKPKLADKSSPLVTGSGKVKHVDKNTTPIKKADTPQSKKSSAMKARKIGFSNEVLGRPCTPPEPEVSSSSEDTKPTENGCDSTSSSPKKTVKLASLDRFVQSTQQPHVTTSAIVDLTDADDEMEDFESPRPSIKKSKPEKRKRESPSQRALEESTKKQHEDDFETLNTSVSSVSSMEQVSDEDSSKKDEQADSNGSTNIEERGNKLMEAAEKILKEEIQTFSSGDQEKEPVTTEAEAITPSILPQPVTPSTTHKPVRKTPLSAKAVQRMKEQEQKREEKQRQREEKKRKLEEENEMKKRQKLEQKKAKEEEKEEQRRQKAEEKKKKEMEKQEKKEKEEQERLEKKKAKEEERLKKQEELDAKQEEKKKKQEERLKVEEEKKQKEAAELARKAKQSQAFKSFFSVPAQAPVKKPEVKGRFVPFEVKKDMVLAPCVRVDSKHLDLKQLDHHLETPLTGSLYLDQLRSGSVKPRKGARTPGPSRPVQESPMDVDVSSSEETSSSSLKKKPGREKPAGLKMKLLQFHENYRPAYYGTWQQKNHIITGRNPFKKDEETFDYDLDSDEEWEEPGESLSHSEGEDEDGDGDDEEEEEDGFFVPHGYLSAGEGGEDEDEDNLKARQAAKAKAWENELARRCKALKPMIVTFIQVASSNKSRQEERKKLEAYQAVPLTSLPIATSFTKREKTKVDESSTAMEADGAAMAQQRVAGGKLKPVPEEAMPELLTLVHGNMAGIKSLIREFRDHWRRKKHGQENANSSLAPSPSPSGSPSLTLGDQGPTASPVEKAGTPVGLGLEASPSPVPGSTPSPQHLDHIDHIISKRQLDLKINSIAVRERRPDRFKRICWYVHDHVLEKYKLTDLPVPTTWVNGVGGREGMTGSPLPPASIASRPAAAMTKPAVSKPVVKAHGLHESSSTVSSLLKASKAQAAQANQQAFIPSSTVASAFNKVVGVSSAAATVHLPGATQFQSTPPIGYLPSGSTLLQPGLTPFQVVPLQMQQAINPAVFGMSNLLQQAAASSLLANMQQTSTIPTSLGQPPQLPNSSVQAPTPNVISNVASLKPQGQGHIIPQTQGCVKQSLPILKPTMRSPTSGNSKLNGSSSCTPTNSSGSTVGPSLPSMAKSPPQRLQTVIAKLYESNALLQNKEKASPTLPVKKTKTLASFFKVQNPKNSEKAEDSPSESQKESTAK